MRHLLSAIVVAVLCALPAAACTGVVIAGEEAVLVGGNEDWNRSDSFVWSTEATDDAYGVLYFGYEIRGEWGQQPDFWYEFHGINDHGLYFDSFGAPCVMPTTTLANPWRGEHLMVEAMETCATVAEAVAFFESSNLAVILCQQFLFVDKHGNAAVVEGDETVWMEGNTFALTNFYLSDPSLGGWPCWRYSRATGMLGTDATPTADRVARILDVTSQPITRYSLVCDLKAGAVRVYYARDFDRYAVIDVTDAVAEALPRTPLDSLEMGTN